MYKQNSNEKLHIVTPDLNTIPDYLETGDPRESLYIGKSPAMREIAQIILTLAQTEKTGALISGESGTGKELIARAIHQYSLRSQQPFIAVNCGAIPPSLIETEFFGSDDGAFTDARQRMGYIEHADHGTLFLDEIGEMPAAAQTLLLRFLERGEFRRVGGVQILRVNTRIIAASLRDLRADIINRVFRPDLFYRINTFMIHAPPLRDRAEDLPQIIYLLAERAAAQQGQPAPRFSREAMQALCAYSWPGNLRQLRNCLERTIILYPNQTISAAAVAACIDARAATVQQRFADMFNAFDIPPDGIDAPKLINLLESALIRKALRQTGDNQSQAARLLGYTRDQLRQRLKNEK